MRTTIELSDDKIAALHALAIRKGQRGYSRIMEEAVDYYLQDQKKRDKDIVKLLSFMGTWTEEESAEIGKKLEEVRKNWNIE
jgi:predicted transcriptional regulator